MPLTMKILQKEEKQRVRLDVLQARSHIDRFKSSSSPEPNRSNQVVNTYGYSDLHRKRQLASIYFGPTSATTGTTQGMLLVLIAIRIWRWLLLCTGIRHVHVSRLLLRWRTSHGRSAAIIGIGSRRTGRIHARSRRILHLVLVGESLDCGRCLVCQSHDINGNLALWWRRKL
jgi:hypothetical protein